MKSSKAAAPLPSPIIIDIRREEVAAVSAKDIVAGLHSSPKQLPELLVYDSHGLQYFSEITKSTDYYPRHSEIKVLSSNASGIVGDVTDGDVFIELGAGDMSKTKHLVRALEERKKLTTFFALDVDREELERSLEQLVEKVEPKFVRFTGLLGTYEDCQTWLDRKKPFGPELVTLVWLGNSICNLQYEEAKSMIAKFAGRPHRNRRMIVSVDGCSDAEQITRAYNMAGDKNRSFVLHSFQHANRVIGSEQFRLNQWEYHGDYIGDERTFVSYVTPKEDVVLEIEGSSIQIPKDEKVHIIKSTKYGMKDFAALCKSAGARMSNAWIGDDGCIVEYEVVPLYKEGGHESNAARL